MADLRSRGRVTPADRRRAFSQAGGAEQPLLPADGSSRDGRPTADLPWRYDDAGASSDDFQHGRPGLLRHFDARVVEMHDVHLQRLHLKILIVAAARTGQRHARLLYHWKFSPLR